MLIGEAKRRGNTAKREWAWIALKFFSTDIR